MKHLREFCLFEAKGITPEHWAGEWQELPEWKLLQLMGFEIFPTEKNSTVSIGSSYSEVVLRLTSAGYVRTSNSGYVYQDKEKDPMPRMLGYVIMRFAKKGIPKIPLDILDSFMKTNPNMIKYLLDLPDIKEGILSRTGISDPLGEIYKKYGLTPSSIKWLNKCAGKRWEIDESTGRINIKSSFIASSENKLGFRGIKFGTVAGDFDIAGVLLTSLEGAPEKIEGLIRLQDTGLTSLKGVTKDVGGDFLCTGNELISLEGSPEDIHGHFYCTDNHLTSLKGAPLKVGRNFVCSHNPLTSLEGAPIEIGGEFLYQNLRIKWDWTGWIKGMNEHPELFFPFIIDKINGADDADKSEMNTTLMKSLTPEIMKIIREKSPEVFDLISKKIGDSASTLADLGELGF
jgi:hypothetical protein